MDIDSTADTVEKAIECFEATMILPAVRALVVEGDNRFPELLDEEFGRITDSGEVELSGPASVLSDWSDTFAENRK